MKEALRAGAALLVALTLISGCSIGSIKSEKRDGNYIVVTDLPDVSLAKVGYKGAAPELRTIAGDEWGAKAAIGQSVAEVINERVKGGGTYIDDAEIPKRISYEKALLLRKLDADDAEFIKQKYAAQSPDYLVLVTKYRLGMSDLYGIGLRQKDIPMADFRCQFFTAIQLDIFELSSGKIESTLTESQTENCPVEKYFDDVNAVDAKALAEIRQNTVRVAAKTANKIARHLLMTDAEKDEFKLRLPGFE